mgnify:CR=1 FL=1
MIAKWEQTTDWQRFVIFGFTIILFVGGMQTWVWESLDYSMNTLDQDIEELMQKNQESTKSIVVLQSVEDDVVALRDKLALDFTPLPMSIGPNAFRKDVANIAKRTGVVVHLWNPQQTFANVQELDSALDIVVSVEGRFYDTVQFIDDVLKLSWVQTVNPVKLARKQDGSDTPLVKTDFTIKGVVSTEIQQTDDLLKT